MIVWTWWERERERERERQLGLLARKLLLGKTIWVWYIEWNGNIN